MEDLSFIVRHDFISIGGFQGLAVQVQASRRFKGHAVNTGAMPLNFRPARRSEAHPSEHELDRRHRRINCLTFCHQMSYIIYRMWNGGVQEEPE